MLYQDFISSKRVSHGSHGFSIDRNSLNPALFDHQRDIVAWALRKGRAAVFADCGMGKTFIQLEWARAVCEHTQGRVLILTPLAVAEQTAREAARFGIPAVVSRDGTLPAHGVVIANYQMLHKFSAVDFVGVVLDESSIIKAFNGKTRNQIIEAFAATPYRLACTATPSPNDHTELGNHAEFLGVMSRIEMLATFFVHDGGETQVWRLKGHAQDEFWKWACSWGVMIRRPSDMGYSDKGYDLPALNIHTHTIDSGIVKSGELFTTEATDLETQRKARRQTLDARCAKVAELANSSPGPWLVWCELNDEGDMLERLISGAVQVSGSDDDEDKADKMLGFADGRYRVLITKPKIAGFGMNWQHCRNVAFVGLSYSFESFYQALRRSYRFGQTHEVNAYIVNASTEGAIIKNVTEKINQHKAMQEKMKLAASAFQSQQKKLTMKTDITTAVGNGWQLHHGDCVRVIREIESESIDFSVFSPPFADLFTYSNDLQDMGNCSDMEEFMGHFGILIDELFRVMKEGRIVAVHCVDLLSTMSKHGKIEFQDFSGEIKNAFRARGFLFHCPITIWKSPVTEMQRTKAHGLLYKTLKSDSCKSRVGCADYLLAFRKPGENQEPVTKDPNKYPVDWWQEVASPVWMTVDQGRVLNKDGARDNNDERHICPLQLDVIERAVELWSNPGDLVYSPFTGIGSEGVGALTLDRRFIGSELKESYFNQARQNLANAKAQLTLF